MSAQDQIEVDRHFDRIKRLLVDDGQDEAERWSIKVGDADTTPREPWLLLDEDDEPLMVLGYTRRSVIAALSTMSEILQIAIG